MYVISLELLEIQLFPLPAQCRLLIGGLFRSSHTEVFCKIGVLKNFEKLETCNFIKKETLAQMFFVNFVKFYRTPLDDCFCLLALNSNLTGCPLYRNQKFQPGVFSSLLFIKTNTFSPEILYLNPNIHHKPTHDDSISTKKRKGAQKTILLFFSLQRLTAHGTGIKQRVQY